MKNKKDAKIKKFEYQKAFSDVDLVMQCLLDKERTLAFKKAINKTVVKSHKVLELGAGSGILSLFASVKAQKVTAIEYDKTIYKFCKNNIAKNSTKNKIEVINGDARNIEFNKNEIFDVVIMEMLTTGMIDEHQVAASNNLHKRKVVSKTTQYIPTKQRTSVQLANFDFSFYGQNLNCILHLWYDFYDIKKIPSLTEEVILNEIKFDEFVQPSFLKKLTCKIIKSGVINCLLLQSTAFLTDELILKDTKTLNAPVIFPLPEIIVKKDQIITFEIKYIFGGGWETFKVKICDIS